MANPRIEEVEDDDIAEDPDEMELDSFDFARPQDGSLGPSMDPAASQIDPAVLQKMLEPQSQQQPSSPGRPQQMSEKERERLQREHQQKVKNFQCIYPIYFDASRSREQGRRVKKEDAVQNPLARSLVDALQTIGNSMGVGLQITFEPSKCHPKDWANPGRVKVQVKKDGRPTSAKIQNKHHLYKMISEYLKSHPTTAETPMQFKIPGLSGPKDDKPPPPAIPRGFKMGSVLPLHSPALSGGGVSDNFLKDMMDEMGGQLPEGMQGLANMASGGGAGGGGRPKPIRIKQGKR